MSHLSITINIIVTSNVTFKRDPTRAQGDGQRSQRQVVGPTQEQVGGHPGGEIALLMGVMIVINNFITRIKR